jgi:hypothetical protein
MYLDMMMNFHRMSGREISNKFRRKEKKELEPLRDIPAPLQEPCEKPIYCQISTAVHVSSLTDYS